MMTPEQNAALLALLARIATALEKQNQLTDELSTITCGIANRVEDLGNCIPSLPISFYSLCESFAPNPSLSHGPTNLN
jgi:hypothetical protein